MVGRLAGGGPADVEATGTSPDECGRTPDARALRRSWLQLIKRIYEVYPLARPNDDSETRVIAFIINHGVIDNFCGISSVPGPDNFGLLPVRSTDTLIT